MFANRFIVILFDLGYSCLKLKKNHEAFSQEGVEYTTLTNYPILIEEAVDQKLFIKMMWKNY